MIVYQNKSVWLLRKLLVLNGSVFPSAGVVAVPCGLVAVLMRVIMDHGGLDFLQGSESILLDSQAWTGFTFLVGFLIVFRTSQAYNRFWDGCTATHQMRAEWLDGVSALTAFAEFSKGRVAPEKTKAFKAKTVRLFSMLHSVALAELEVMGCDFPPLAEVAAFRYDVIDPAGLDSKTLRLVQQSSSKVQLVYCWIQCVMVEGIKDGVLTIPAPILSRAFQEIANGMVAFHDAVKISSTPFPFPYTQTCDCLLVMHWIITPFVTNQWVNSWPWACIFVFIQAFVLWALNFIAIEIENPFGTDPNDLDGRTMQAEMNQHLLLLLRETATRTPSLSSRYTPNEAAEDGSFRLQSFYDVWGTSQSMRDALHGGSEKSTVRSWWDALSPRGLWTNLSTSGVSQNPEPDRFYKQSDPDPASPTSSPRASRHESRVEGELRERPENRFFLSNSPSPAPASSKQAVQSGSSDASGHNSKTPPPKGAGIKNGNSSEAISQGHLMRESSGGSHGQQQQILIDADALQGLGPDVVEGIARLLQQRSPPPPDHYVCSNCHSWLDSTGHFLPPQDAHDNRSVGSGRSARGGSKSPQAADKSGASFHPSSREQVKSDLAIEVEPLPVPPGHRLRPPTLQNSLKPKEGDSDSGDPGDWETMGDV
mmetsp:Transcript_32228/g.73696  ORF Transcript_32228/g.73696 Transcript_32228/m.73696 type:complete len:649 (-) Transcript_32228:121-2067(-)